MQYAGTNDVTERALRALILKVANAKDQRKDVPNDSSFVNNAHFAVVVSLLATAYSLINRDMRKIEEEKKFVRLALQMQVAQGCIEPA